MSFEPANPTLPELHAAIVAGLSAALPKDLTVAAYPVLSRTIRLPAVLVDLSEMEPGEDPGTGETAVVGIWQARCIVDPNATDAYLQLRTLAAQVICTLRAQNWGLPVEVAKFAQAGEDSFHPELDGYLVWLVEWRQEFHLGEYEWPWPDEHLEIMLGIYPETGPGNEPDYWPLGEAPPDDWGETK